MPRINFWFMTPGPAPRRRVGRASRSDVAGQSKLCTAPYGRAARCCVPPSRSPRQPAQHTQWRRVPVAQWCDREVGAATRARGRDQGNRKVTSRDGVPRLPRQAGDERGTPARATANRMWPRLGTPRPIRSGVPSTPARPGRALPLQCVPLAGGAGVSWSGVTGRERERRHGPVGHGRTLHYCACARKRSSCGVAVCSTGSGWFGRYFFSPDEHL